MSRPLGRRRAAALFVRLAEANPDPETELVYSDPFTLLVAVVLSAQSTDVGVNRVTPALFVRAPNAAALAALSEAEIAGVIASLGLYRNKARHLAALGRQLVAQHGGEVPSTHDALMQLPGVGRKTANVVMNVAFGAATIAVDTHIFRVANRTGLAAGRTPDAVETGLLAITPVRFRRGAHHWLILHGRYVCKARRPDCPRCLIADLCNFPAKTLESAP